MAELWPMAFQFNEELFGPRRAYFIQSKLIFLASQNRNWAVSNAASESRCSFVASVQITMKSSYCSLLVIDVQRMNPRVPFHFAACSEESRMLSLWLLLLSPQTRILCNRLLSWEDGRCRCRCRHVYYIQYELTSKLKTIMLTWARVKVVMRSSCRNQEMKKKLYHFHFKH